MDQLNNKRIASSLMRSTTTLVLVVLVGLMGLFLIFWSDKTEPTKIKIGIISSFTGTGASRGESGRMGLELALNRIRNEKSFSQVHIELVYQDVPLDKPKDGIAEFNHLADVEKVAAVIGPMGSNVAVSVTPMVDAKKIPTIIHTASALKVTQDNDYVFRLWPTANTYADAVMKEIRKRGYTKIAFLSSQHENTTDLLRLIKEQNRVSNLFSAVWEESVAPDTKDFRSALAKLSNIQADALFLNVHERQHGNAAKQLAELGITLPLFTNSTMSAVELAICPTCFEGTWFPQFAGYDQSQKRLFIERFGKEPSDKDSAAAAHDALLAIAYAVADGGSEPDKIKNYLYHNTFEGISGTVAFSESGDARIPVKIFEISQGTFQSTGR